MSEYNELVEPMEHRFQSLDGDELEANDRLQPLSPNDWLAKPDRALVTLAPGVSPVNRKLMKGLHPRALEDLKRGMEQLMRLEHLLKNARDSLKKSKFPGLSHKFMREIQGVARSCKLNFENTSESVKVVLPMKEYYTIFRLIEKLPDEVNKEVLDGIIGNLETTNKKNFAIQRVKRDRIFKLGVKVLSIILLTFWVYTKLPDSARKKLNEYVLKAFRPAFEAIRKLTGKSVADAGKAMKVSQGVEDKLMPGGSGGAGKVQKSTPGAPSGHNLNIADDPAVKKGAAAVFRDHNFRGHQSQYEGMMSDTNLTKKEKTALANLMRNSRWSVAEKGKKLQLAINAWKNRKNSGDKTGLDFFLSRRAQLGDEAFE